MKEIKVNIESPTFCGQVSYEEAIKEYGLEPIRENDIPDGLEITIHIDNPLLESESELDINLPISDLIDNSEIIEC